MQNFDRLLQDKQDVALAAVYCKQKSRQTNPTEHSIPLQQPVHIYLRAVKDK